MQLTLLIMYKKTLLDINGFFFMLSNINIEALPPNSSLRVEFFKICENWRCDIKSLSSSSSSILCRRGCWDNGEEVKDNVCCFEDERGFVLNIQFSQILKILIYEDSLREIYLNGFWDFRNLEFWEMIFKHNSWRFNGC